MIEGARQERIYQRKVAEVVRLRRYAENRSLTTSATLSCILPLAQDNHFQSQFFRHMFRPKCFGPTGQNAS